MCEAGEKAESECLVQALTFVREVCVWGGPVQGSVGGTEGQGAKIPGLLRLTSVGFQLPCLTS